MHLHSVRIHTIHMFLEDIALRGWELSTKVTPREKNSPGVSLAYWCILILLLLGPSLLAVL